MAVKIRVQPTDFGGCGHYRMIWPAKALGIEPHTDDYQVVVESSSLGNRVVDVVDPPDVDVIVLQRPLRRQTCELIQVFQRKYGIAIVVEIDDNYEALPLQHPERNNTNPLNKPDYNWNWLKRSCEYADLVVASTPLLAQIYGAHGRVVVIPNYVPRWYLDVQREPHAGTWLGWTGSTRTHIRDLMVVKDAVKRTIAETGAELHVVGSGEDVARQLQLDTDPITPGWLDIEEYPVAYGQFDVAFCPLRITPFNQGKSHLKGVEAAALGVPVVMSPSDEYLRLNEQGIGDIARSPDDWFFSLTRLCRDGKFRADRATAAREIVAEKFILEDHAWQWKEAWEAAIALRAERA